MNVNTRVKPRVQQANNSTKKEFNYNAQDPLTMPSDKISIDVNAAEGGVETDTVVLDNKNVILVFGIPFVLDDPDYKLNPNADGDFVFPRDHESFTGANAFGAAAATVNKYNEVYSSLTGKTIDWAFDSPQLKVSPESGEWANAFYARAHEGVHFFDVEDTSTGNSGEVASHEVGHAVLDGLRPNWLGGQGNETGAFHEAFGDVLAMLMTLGNGPAVDKIIEQTGGGDLSSNRNALSDMGEGFGAAIGKEGGIRTSFNKFTYKDPATLPERGDEDNLGHEVHDFSRLWSGAFYDVLDGIADANRAEGMSPKEALMAAGEEGWKLLVAQMEKAPSGSETNFKHMATALAAGDAEFNGGKRQELITDIMVRRELMAAGTGLFKSAGVEFSGTIVDQELTLGEEFGMLAGVKLETKIDLPTFSTMSAGGSQAVTDLQSEALKGVKTMMQDGDILFTDKKELELGDMFKPDGTTYRAYVNTNENGERELHGMNIAVCNFSHGPDSDHGHSHGHIHGENCNHGH